jgi:hypothetical protein
VVGNDKTKSMAEFFILSQSKNSSSIGFLLRTSLKIFSKCSDHAPLITVVRLSLMTSKLALRKRFAKYPRSEMFMSPLKVKEKRCRKRHGIVLKILNTYPLAVNDIFVLEILKNSLPFSIIFVKFDFRVTSKSSEKKLTRSFDAVHFPS